MNISILGTGRVAFTLAAALTGAGHVVILGSRTRRGVSNDVPVFSSREAVERADLVINATQGAGSLELLTAIGAEAFGSKTVIDVANANTEAFDLIYPNSSLGEKLQEALPEARIVKTMNTAAMPVMTSPTSLPEASSVFVSGDDDAAKAQAASLLLDLGWSAESIIDLGGIRTARGVEHYFLFFASLMQVKKTPLFNIRVVS
ncbi:NADPH-dependent F420 reductase [Lacisediminihabitans sp.]|uniref:NADPH-dependent F420 reductase n=1 Tax=Lacisediminihabitans sp. TaxID=2787631 RepID=UPI00374D537A